MLELEEEARRLIDQCSNWGRWGEDDELGTLNYITQEKRSTAARLVTVGRAFSIGKDLSTVASPKNQAPPVHLMLYEQHSPGASADYFGIAPHGFSVTHLDAIGHVYWDGMVYNGRLASEVVTRRGLDFASIYAMRDGIFTRGLLLDVASAQGAAWLPPTAYVNRVDLEAAERMAGVRVEAGDAVIVRVGLEAREAVDGPEDVAERAGLSADAVAWLHERQVAVFGGDCIERIPYPSVTVPAPLHQIGSARMGLVLLENLDVELLQRECLDLGRNEFLITVAPLRFPYATGSPVNPLVVF